MADNRYRLTYAKTDTARYIGHLDLQRVFQRAVRRADLRVRYSEGFNPHSIVRLAQPLSLGMTGLAELLEIDLKEALPPDTIKERLNTVLPAGLTITRCEPVAGGKAAALIQAAVYDIELHYDESKIQPDFSRVARELLLAPEVKLQQTRTGQDSKEVDIRPLIHELYADGNHIRAVIACGGKGNLKPSLLAEELCRLAGVTLDPYKTEYCRRELVL